EDIPLKASITPLAGNQTASATPTFSFTAASTFSPTAPPVESLVYQVDTWQGAWLAAASDGSGGFSGAPPALAPGFHIIYAYSTDGQEATLGASAYGEEMSPLISNITAYGFLAAFPQVTLSTTSMNFGDQPIGTPSLPQTVTLTNSGTSTLDISSVDATGDFAETNTCGSSVAAGASCAISVTFTPGAVGSSSSSLTVTDNNNGVSGSEQTVSLAGVGVAPVVSLSSSSLSF